MKNVMYRRQKSGTEALPQDSHDVLATLSDQKYIRLATFRRSGAPVPTPVWFARHGDRLYVTTSEKSWKVKRIRRNPAVRVAPCSPTGKPLGPGFDAVARILPPAESQKAAHRLREKYGWLLRLFLWFSRRRGQEHVYLEIAPERA